MRTLSGASPLPQGGGRCLYSVCPVQDQYGDRGFAVFIQCDVWRRISVGGGLLPMRQELTPPLLRPNLRAFPYPENPQRHSALRPIDLEG